MSIVGLLSLLSLLCALLAAVALVLYALQRRDLRSVGEPSQPTGPAAGAEREVAHAPKLFAELGDRVHEAVLVHRDVILYSNPQFASFVGVDRVELIGRRLADLVTPEYAELVSDNIRRRLAGESAAERYEIDMVGLQGQVSRLEITSSVVDYDRGNALLITGVEILPTQTPQAPPAVPPTAAAPAAVPRC